VRRLLAGAAWFLTALTMLFAAAVIYAAWQHR